MRSQVQDEKLQYVSAVYLHWPFSTINVVLHETRGLGRERSQASRLSLLFASSLLVLMRAGDSCCFYGKVVQEDQDPEDAARAQPLCSFPFKYVILNGSPENVIPNPDLATFKVAVPKISLIMYAIHMLGWLVCHITKVL